MTTVSCNHPEFAAEVDVVRLEDIGAFSADVRIRCIGCDEPFAFIGIEPGLSGDGPRVSISQLEAHLPIRPSTAGLGSGARYGFRVQVAGFTVDSPAVPTETSHHDTDRSAERELARPAGLEPATFRSAT